MVGCFRLDWPRRGLLLLAAAGSFATAACLGQSPAPANPEPRPALNDTPPAATTAPAQGVPAAVFPAAVPAQAAPQTVAPAQPSIPGVGAQIRTGTTIGPGGAQSDANRIANLLADHQYATIEVMLDPAISPVTLTPQQRDLFRGVLLNRENKSAESVKLLAPLVDQLGSDSKPADQAQEKAQEKLLRKTLAEDYLRLGDWANAAKAYQALDARTALTAEEKDDLELPLKLLPLAAAHPAMTVEYGDPFSVPYDRDPLGLMDVPVFVDAQSHDWMLDPTAPFNLICRSTAKEVGLKLSAESATVQTITGRPITVRATVIPRFTLGNVTFRNMTAFVFEDADYYYARSRYQVRGVLGYPALSALGSVTVTQSARIEVQPGDKGERVTAGARFYLEGDRVMAALGRSGEERMYQVDSSGQQTYLTSRYFSEHPADFAGKRMQLLAVPGAASKPPAPAYVAEQVNLSIGAATVSFHNIQVLTEPLGNAPVDDSYGILGVDALDELKSYTFDYRTMLFSARPE